MCSRGRAGALDEDDDVGALANHLSDHDLLMEVNHRQFVNKQTLMYEVMARGLLDNDFIIEQVVARKLGLQLLEKYPWAEELPEIPEGSSPEVSAVRKLKPKSAISVNPNPKP